MEAVGPERVAVLPEDAYYREYQHLAEAERARINWDHPDAIEEELLLAHVETLAAGRPIERPCYDFAAYARSAETVHVAPRPILLVEGILLFVEPRLRERFDVKVFVDTHPDLPLIRPLTRHAAQRGRPPESH